MPASRANVKTIQASTYTSEYFRIFDNTIFLHRDHRFAKDTRDIDCHGSYWSLGFVFFEPGQVTVRRRGKRVPLNGFWGFFIPPFSIIDWNLGPGELHGDGFISNAPLPDDLPTEAFAFRLAGTDPARHEPAWESEDLKIDSNQKLFDLIRTTLGRVSIEKEELPSSISKRVKKCLSENFREECPIQEVAGRLGYSHSVMTRCFKRDFDLSPVEYRSRVRVFEALMTMMSTDALVTQTQVQVGFNSASVFYKQFKKITLVKPSLISI